MKVYIETLRHFQPWGRAVSTFETIENAEKLDDLELLIEELYPDGISETQLNDILWVEEDWLFEQLGLSEEEEH